MLTRYTITPESPLITPIMSDTLFGHFCWALRYRDGESKLTEFLDGYGNGRAAPVLFSSAFPSGHLPRPSLPSPSRNALRTFVRENVGESKAERFDGLSQVKKWSKRRTISLDDWRALKGGYSDLRLYQRFAERKDYGQSEPSFKTDVTASNRIDRLTGTVPSEGGGGLFQRSKIWYLPGATLDLYVEVDTEERSGDVDWFLQEFLPDNGFGADKSVGMGMLRIKRDDGFKPADLDVPDANARISLSLAAFAGMEEIFTYYRLTTKLGKLGGSFAVTGPNGGNPRPYKKPLLMYEPGAVFFTEQPLNTRPLLDNVHSDNRIRHCGIPITLPMKITEEVARHAAA